MMMSQIFYITETKKKRPNTRLYLLSLDFITTEFPQTELNRFLRLFSDDPNLGEEPNFFAGPAYGKRVTNHGFDLYRFKKLDIKERNSSLAAGFTLPVPVR
jgi:hypothetical protein